MWKLVNNKKDHIEKFILPEEELIVGRKDANLLITNDPSVSRKHATLFVKHPEENLSNPGRPSSLFLRDEGSKYGTFKNGVRVTSEVELSNSDVVKFGQFESEYRVCKLPLVVTTSCLDLLGKRELKKTLHSLGGHLVSEWQPSCTHLVMSEIKVTIKALCCLCSPKPIVKPEYFTALKNSIKDSSTYVQPHSYIPPIGEALIDKEKVSFDIKEQRQRLFKKKKFFFLDEKQFKKLQLGIILGGGQASVLSPNEVSPSLLLQEGCCVIEPSQAPTQETQGLMQEVRTILHRKKLRMIPESDVGLAVAYCSTEKFCNPEFSMGDAVLQSPNLQSQTLSQREVYVPDTQERNQRYQKAREIVPEVGDSLNFSSYRAEPPEEMELCEIPLSAQVKRELADIFDEPMDEEVEVKSPPKKTSRLSLSNSEDKTLKLKREPSRSAVTEVSSDGELNEEPPAVTVKKEATYKNFKVPSIPEQNETVNKSSPSTSRKRAKNDESHVTADSQLSNGKSERVSDINPLSEVNDIPEHELPRNLVRVEIVSLVYKRNIPTPALQQYKNSSVKNFKKFKKVYPKKAQALPKIIGAHELVPYDKVAAQIMNEAWDDPAEEAPQPIKGAFDWDTPTV